MFHNSLNDGCSAARLAMGSVLLFSAAVLPAQAQTAAAKTGPADPTDSHASVPAVRHASTLAGYRPLQEAPPASWQQANEKANRAGGWRAYAREKAAPDAPAAAASAAKGHEGHAPQ